MTDKRDPTPIMHKWEKRKLYQCRLCDFNTLEEEKFIDHFGRMHPPLQIIDGGRQGQNGDQDKKGQD